MIVVVWVFAFAKADYSCAQWTEGKAESPQPKQTLAQKLAAPGDDKQIGLVLSGGGAKGFAHIGVLKVIDSLGIKVDYIGGTSMGAVVGSLYASGYTGKQLDSLFNTLDLEELVNDDLPRGARSFFERRDEERYAVTLPFNDFQITLPSGLSKGQNFYNLMVRLMSHVSSEEDFTKLPIPFLCMVTDIETGEEVLIDHGYLPIAVNASAAMPSLFAPVEMDGRLMVDGGVRNNYPVQELLDRGMDIIIGSDVQDDLKTRDEIQSGLDILTQINNLSTIDAMVVNKQKTDIYITPDIAGFSVVDFDRGNDMIDNGATAALAEISKLKKISTPGYQKPELNLSRPDTIYIDRLHIDGLNDFSRAYITGKLNLDLPGLISYEQFNNGINNLQATGNFTKINYIIDRSGGESAILLEVQESEVKNYLRLGLHYDELLGSAALVGLARRNLLFDNDKASFDAILGDNIRYRLDYFIDKGNYWSVGLSSDFVQFKQQVATPSTSDFSGIPEGLNSLSIEYYEFNHRIYGQTHLGKGFTGRIGAEAKYLNIFSNTFGGEDDPRAAVFERSLIGSIYGRVQFDNLDDPSFPDCGWYARGEVQSYLFSEVYFDGFTKNFEPFTRMEVEVKRAQSLGRFSLTGGFSGGAPLGDPVSNSLDFFLGGYGFGRINNLVSFYGYPALSEVGDTYLKLALDLDYEIFNNNHITVGANFANVGDCLIQIDNWFGDFPMTGYALGYGLDTFLGPIEVKYSFSPETEDDLVFVKLGYPF